MALWLVIKVLHVLFGVFWVGSAMVNVRFLLPSVEASGPAGGVFMRELMGVRKYPVAITIAGLLTVIAGFLLLWHVTLGFQPEQFRGFHRMMLSTGIAAALFAFLHGVTAIAPNAFRMGKLAESLQGPPTPEQAAELEMRRGKLKRGATVSLVLLVIALIGMALSHPI